MVGLMRRGISVLLPILMVWFLWPAGALAGEWVFGPFGAGVPYNEGAQHGLAMNGPGEAALIFGFNGVRVSLRPVGGSFEDPEWGGVRVSAEGVEGSTPAVAIDDQGNVVTVWRQNTGPHPRIYAATRHAGGSFGAPVAVSAEGEEATEPTVAVDAAGETTVVWLSNDGTSEVVQAATAALGGTYSSPATLSGDGVNASDPHVTVDQSGDTVVAWTREGDLNVATRQAGRSFPAPYPGGDGEVLGELASSSTPHIVVDEAGEALAVWKAPSGSVRAMRRPAGVPAFGPGETLAVTTGLPSAAMNESGEAVVAWPSGLGVEVTTATPGAAFGAPTPIELLSGFVPAAAQVAIGARGNVAVEWEATTTEKGGWWSRRAGSSRPPGGSFAEPTSLGTGDTPVEGSLAVASDSAGDMIGVWTSSLLDDMESMLYDAGPQLDGISAPTTGVVGQPLSFSIASPPSVWTPLRSVTWNFRRRRHGERTVRQPRLRHAGNLPGRGHRYGRSGHGPDGPGIRRQHRISNRHRNSGFSAGYNWLRL